MYSQSLVIKPKKQKEYSLKELIKGITPKNRHKLTFDGPDVGKEKIIKKGVYDGGFVRGGR